MDRSTSAFYPYRPRGPAYAHRRSHRCGHDPHATDSGTPGRVSCQPSPGEVVRCQQVRAGAHRPADQGAGSDQWHDLAVRIGLGQGVVDPVGVGVEGVKEFYGLSSGSSCKNRPVKRS